ncbi:MAG: TonB-dependent receptor [Acidobacteria bacterium]|nr:TonB-dependent receptor [Acidobacteriota bacterium]
MRDLTSVSLEDLMKLEVTSVAKKEQKLSQVPAAVHVITEEDIRRSGAQNLAEALRLAPGLHVARLDKDEWAISARGFNDQFSNKMLVLIDGRSVYTGLFSGVFWNVQDTNLRDVARIEVIRGPGATMWGANAVNGVINIITKSAAETQGGLLVASTGQDNRGYAATRWGGTLGRKGHYRVFGQSFRRSPDQGPENRLATVGADMMRGGFRADWNLSSRDSATLQGDLYRYGSGEETSVATLQAPYHSDAAGRLHSTGGNLLARWKRRYSETSEVAFQVYFDRTARDGSLYQAAENTLDFDFQHHLALGRRNDLVWGGGYRNIHDRVDGGFPVSVQPSRRNSQWTSAFVQDEIKLIPERLSLIAGTKLEHNSFTGFEVEPGARFLWTPNSRDTYWASVSRAVRTPSIGELGVRLNQAVFPGAGGLPNVVSILGNPSLRSETVTAWEAGYRRQISGRLSLDLAAFHNDYRHLLAGQGSTPFLASTPEPAHVVAPLVLGNHMSGETSGTEAAATWNVTAKWRLMPSYSWVRMAFNAQNLDPVWIHANSKYPRHQGQVRSYLDLPGRLQLDTAVFAVGALPAIGVPGYLRVDARLGRSFGENGEFSVGAQNLARGSHPEFYPTLPYARSEVSRNVYVKLTWWF